MSCMVKICGINSEDAVIAAMSAGADALGYVFFPASPRHVSLNGARTLTERVPNSILKVGLFVDAGNEAMENAIKAGNLDVIQMHGDETPERVRDVAETFGLKTMKAIPISTAEDLNRAGEMYDGVADFLLFDAKPPKDSALPGGNAIAFDWSLLSGRDWKSNWMLAGGLTPENVAQAVAITDAPWVDVSSGVERIRGLKDSRKINAFVQAAKGY